MTTTIQHCPLREVYQNGKWRLFRSVSGSKASRYETVTERNYCWQKVKSSQDGKGDDFDKTSKYNSLSKQISQQNASEMSQIMKRDILTRVSPWISTTHSDFYSQLHPKLTGKEHNASITVKDSKPDDMDKLVCCVKQVPLVRMICYNHKHFVSTYNHDFEDPNPHVFKSLLTYEDDFDFSRKPGEPSVPYGSKKWTTSHRFDYGQLPKPKTKEAIVVPDSDLLDTPREPLHKSDWTTTYEDYGHNKQRNAITTIPCPKLPEEANFRHIKIPITSEVGQLFKY